MTVRWGGQLTGAWRVTDSEALRLWWTQPPTYGRWAYRPMVWTVQRWVEDHGGRVVP